IRRPRPRRRNTWLRRLCRGGWRSFVSAASPTVDGNMIAFIDLAAQQARIKPQIDAAIEKVLAHGQYGMGPEVRTLEAQLAEFGRARYALSCGNGTDALALPLMAWDIGPGDAVFCPSFTFAATPE